MKKLKTQCLKEKRVSKKWEKRFKDENPLKFKKKECEDTIRAFQVLQIEKQIKNLQAELILAENSDGIAEILDLIKDLNNEKANLLALLSN